MESSWWLETTVVSSRCVFRRSESTTGLSNSQPDLRHQLSRHSTNVRRPQTTRSCCKILPPRTHSSTLLFRRHYRAVLGCDVPDFNKHFHRPHRLCPDRTSILLLTSSHPHRLVRRDRSAIRHSFRRMRNDHGGERILQFKTPRRASPDVPLWNGCRLVCWAYSTDMGHCWRRAMYKSYVQPPEDDHRSCRQLFCQPSLDRKPRPHGEGV